MKKYQVKMLNFKHQLYKWSNMYQDKLLSGEKYSLVVLLILNTVL